jgi:hypothetical protein
VTHELSGRHTRESESGVSSTPQPLDSIIHTLEYWIIRWSLSSGGVLRRPGDG